MTSISPEPVLKRLRDRSLRNNVALWLLATDQIVRLSDQAAGLGIDYVDILELHLDSLPAETRFADLRSGRLTGLLDKIATSSGASKIALVENLDLLLARLPYDELQDVWRTMWQGFPYRPRGLLLAMPALAGHLLPKSNELAAWRDEGRLAGWVQDDLSVS